MTSLISACSPGAIPGSRRSGSGLRRNRACSIATVAALRRLGLPLPLERAAGAIERTARWIDRFGSGTGGVQVTLTGATPDGVARQIIRRVVVPDNHGPEIPCMAAILVSSELARVELTGAGARPCVGLVGLDEFTPEFARWGMTTSVEERQTVVVAAFELAKVLHILSATVLIGTGAGNAFFCWGGSRSDQVARSRPWDDGPVPSALSAPASRRRRSMSLQRNAIGAQG